VKVIGVRSIRSFSMASGTSVAADLDWNHQDNGSYLSMSLMLVCEGSDGMPQGPGDWLRVDYIGVPPAANARMEVVRSHKGVIKTLFDEGWPDKRRQGRPIGRQRVELTIADGGLILKENGKTVWQSPSESLGLVRAHLQFQISSHSNYPARELFIDDLKVQRH
jgi:hypothetical protein